MGSRAKKRKVSYCQDEDNISLLPDDLIHKILSFLDVKVALQTSVLSKRWKFIWTTLPFLNFGEYRYSSCHNTDMLMRHVLSNRNHQSHISKLNLFAKYDLPKSLVYKFVEYAISHNVEYLSLNLAYIRDDPYKLSTLRSKSLKNLMLRVNLEEFATELDYWDLPALTSLSLLRPYMGVHSKLPESCLTCLPALRTLCLDKWDFSRSSFSFNLPRLTTLRLSGCSKLPPVWNFPALLSLELDGTVPPKNISDIFSKLVNLQNLKLILSFSSFHQNHVISCPQLLNLNIGIFSCQSLSAEIKFLAPKLRNFSSFGIFEFWLEVPKLENVNIKLSSWFGNLDWIYRKRYYRRFTHLLSQLGNARILTFDLESIQALSAIDFLASLPSPFYNLKIVKLPYGYEESRISSALRSYLLDGSPGATIATTLPQNRVNHSAAPVPRTSKKVMLNQPLATPTNVNSVLDDARVSGASVAGTNNDQAISSRGHNDFGLWHGHEVNSEFVGLLDLIMKNYPGTFEHFTAKSEKFYTLKLNLFCTSVNDFLKTSMNEFNTDIIAEYKDLFADMQRWGFDVNWLESHLNYIEQLHFSPHGLHATYSHMDNAKIKFQDLQTHCMHRKT